MLKTMREGGAYFIKGVMLVVVITFIGTIFVVWGVKSTPGDLARRGVMATVGNMEITQEEYQQALRRQIDMYKQVFGDRMDEKMLDSLNLKQVVADQLVRREIVLQYAAQHGLQAEPAEVVEAIRQVPAFSGKEGFTKQRYLDVLRANRMTPERFESQVRQDLTAQKVEELVRDSAMVSDAELREAFRLARQKLTLEVVQLPAGDEGKKLADAITVALGKQVPLAAAAKDAGAAAKTIGPFPVSAPPPDIPDPQAVVQAARILKVGETSPLVTGAKASYLLRLVTKDDPTSEEYEKERDTFRTQYLAMKREMVLADWQREIRKNIPVKVEIEGL